jgi:hypothetical protein
MKHLVLIIIATVLLFSCGKDNEAPAYLEVQEIVLEAAVNPSYNQGELTHNFSDAWVYVDGDLLGVFELPCKLPLNYEGTRKITIIPGIRNNGISATKLRYPFVEQHIEYVTLTRNETVTVQPKTRYYADLFFWIEDFEDAAVKIENTIYSKATLEKGSDPEILQYGNYYGVVNLTPQDSLWDAVTTDLWNIPKGRPVFVEIDYYNTNSLLTGLKAINAQGFNANPYILLNPQQTDQIVWKKIYLDFREIVGFSVNYNSFQFMLTAVLAEGTPDSFVCIDNIKLIY